jgi:hypothetical protein
MPIGLEGKYYPADTVTSRAIGDELFLMHRATQATYSLNETSSFIWRLCDGAATGYDIRDAVVDRYGITSDESARNVIDLLDTLFREVLLVRSDDHA